MTKQLLIDADDFGLAEGVDRGIVECYNKGAVTGLSLLAVGDSFERAVQLARKNGIKHIGVHLALTDSFKAVSRAKEIPTLVDARGRFPKSYFAFLARYFTGGVKNEEIYKELKNQIHKVRKEGFKITRINSHQHMHMVPGILKAVLRLMNEEGVEYVRFPLERISIVERFLNPRMWLRNILLSSMCRVSKELLYASNARYNDYFIGHAAALKLRKKDFVHAVSSLEDGLTELCCHPGHSTRRESELKALCDEGFKDELRRNSVELVTY